MAHNKRALRRVLSLLKALVERSALVEAKFMRFGAFRLNGYGYVQCRQTCTKLNKKYKLMDIIGNIYKQTRKHKHFTINGVANLKN